MSSSCDEQRLITIDTDAVEATLVATLSPDVDLVQTIAFAPSGTLIGSSLSSVRSLYDIDLSKLRHSAIFLLA